MIEQVIHGDLIADCLNASLNMFDGIAHGANCHNAMGAGIAAQIAREIPEAVIADNKTIPGDRNKLGTFTRADFMIGRLVVEPRFIYNLYTQFYPGRDASYQAIFQAFEAMCRDLRERKFTNRPRVAVPLIGCGIGGLEWASVRQIIDYTSNDVAIIVYEYKGK